MTEKEKDIFNRVRRGFQGIEKIVVGFNNLKTVCMKVLEGELILKGMYDWLENVKKLNVSYVVFVNYLNCNGFEEVRKRYSYYFIFE